MAEFNRQDHLSITGDRNFDGSMSVDEFMKYMPPQLQIARHFKLKNLTSCCEYVVFSQRDQQNSIDLSRISCTIKQRIESALIHLHNYEDLLSYKYGLIQFWSPVTIDGRRYLVTTENPFSITYLDRGLCSYRKHCMGYQYSADWEDADTGHLFGPPGRVFLNETPEAAFIVDYSVNEYPLRDYALTCRANYCIFIPVYEPKGRQCIGVVEYNYLWYDRFFCRDLLQALQCANLKFKHHPSLFSNHSDAKIEIELVLKHLCAIQYIPFARVWRPKTSGYMVTQQKSKTVNNIRYNSINVTYYKHRLKACLGVVGKAFSSLTSCFCENLSRLNTDVYPLVLDASKVDVVSSFAVCLRHSTTGYQVHILEFFFSNLEITSSEPLKLVRSVLETIKHEFPNFKQASGQDLGAVDIHILSPFPDDVVDVAPPGPTSNNSNHPCEIPIAKVPTEREFMHNGGEMFRLSFEQPSTMVFAPNDLSGEETFRSSFDQPSTMVLAPNGLSGAEMIRSNQPSVENGHNIDRMQKDVDEIGPLHNDQTVIAPHNLSEAEMMLSSAENVQSIDKSLKGVDDIGPSVNDLEMEVRITREVLEQHVVTKLELVARHLEVSRSTFKRICRKHKIKNWRSFTKSMVNRMHPDSVKAAEEHIKHGYCRTGDQGFSLLKNNNSSGEIVQSIPKKRRIENGKNVTVKATYEGDMIKFEFCVVSKIADLVEKIAKRFNLKSNGFKIKYEDEDGDWILLATEEDLTKCFRNVRSYRNNIIYVKIENILNVTAS